MGARSFITARLMETWAHGQDVADALHVRAHADRPAAPRRPHRRRCPPVQLRRPTARAEPSPIRVELVGPVRRPLDVGTGGRRRSRHRPGARLLPARHPAPPPRRRRRRRRGPPPTSGSTSPSPSPARQAKAADGQRLPLRRRRPQRLRRAHRRTTHHLAAPRPTAEPWPRYAVVFGLIWLALVQRHALARAARARRRPQPQLHLLADGSPRRCLAVFAGGADHAEMATAIRDHLTACCSSVLTWQWYRRAAHRRRTSGTGERPRATIAGMIASLVVMFADRRCGDTLRVALLGRRRDGWGHRWPHPW
jgi:hypothetical protein